MSIDPNSYETALRESYDKELTAIAAQGGPIGLWYQGLKEQALAGELEQKAEYEFVFAGLRSFLDLRSDHGKALELEKVMEIGQQAAIAHLEGAMKEPALAAVERIYHENMGNPNMYSLAYANFLGTLSITQLQRMLSFACWTQILFDDNTRF